MEGRVHAGIEGEDEGAVAQGVEGIRGRFHGIGNVADFSGITMPWEYHISHRGTDWTTEKQRRMVTFGGLETLYYEALKTVNGHGTK
jgi:hypothetical protein